MECDKCKFRQAELHQQPTSPVVYYCCRCNGCSPGCKAKGTNVPTSA